MSIKDAAFAFENLPREKLQSRAGVREEAERCWGREERIAKGQANPIGW